jgi:hypothetical protein
MKPTPIDWSKVFELRCEAKRGQRLTPEQQAYVEAAHAADPARYAEMSPEVFEATRPVGSERRPPVPALPEIKLTPVASSNVEGIGYDEATKIARVRFKNGATYRYTGVSKELHESIMAAPSVGKAITQLRAFPCTKEPT